ncbi:MAG: hypothetical protein IJA54_08285 [Tyzzerella sp.]|nr:hypothetical protein [Tyzzerella sp.]
MIKEGRFFKTILMCLILGMFSTTITVHADMGPKPSIQITFEGMGPEKCYGTLLSESISTGPSTAWDGTEADAKHNENELYSYKDLDYETWKAFVEYTDVDGFYFLQEGWQVNGTKELDWVYYPPSTFKILLYYPESGTFLVSDIYEKYAFDSYYTVDMSKFQQPTDKTQSESEETEKLVLIEKKIEAEKSYDYKKEIGFLLIRILATIAIELVIAVMFGFTMKKQFLLLTGVNVVTQVILNVLLNVLHYKMGPMAYKMSYIFFELIVFVIEATLYCKFLGRYGNKERSTRYYISYAFVANLISFAAGFFIAK